jgi:hypothetical protein
MRCFNRRKYQQEKGQMSSNFGEIVKKLIPVFGEKPARGLPKPPPPPPPRTVPGFGDSHTWRKCQIESPSAKSGRPNETPEWGRRGGIPGFLNNSTTEHYFKMLLSHEDVYSFSSPYCIGKLCSSPFYVPGG